MSKRGISPARQALVAMMPLITVQIMGLRYVYSGNAKDGGAYIDLGAHARITNKHFLFGVFVQLGIFGGHK